MNIQIADFEDAMTFLDRNELRDALSTARMCDDLYQEALELLEKKDLEYMCAMGYEGV